MAKDLSHIALPMRTTDPRQNQFMEKVCQKINDIIDYLAVHGNGPTGPTGPTGPVS